MSTPSDFDTQSWRYVETGFEAERAACNESLFAVGNGYLGVRGYFDEGYPGPVANATRAAFLNGVYESLPIEYDESAYGFARNCHRIVSVPRHRFSLQLDGQWLSLAEGDVLSHHRFLDFRTGQYQRHLTWRSPTGHTVKLTFTRAASLTQRSLMLARVIVESVDYTGPMRLASALETGQGTGNDIDDPRKGGSIPASHWQRVQQEQTGTVSAVQYRTCNSGLHMAAAMVTTGPEANAEAFETGSDLGNHYDIDARAGEQYSLETVIAYVDSRVTATEELVSRARSLASEGMDTGLAALLAEQETFLDRFWSNADIEIDSDDGAQYAARFALFHLLQSTGTDGVSSIAAKGVTGSGYDGHYFWDAETYVFPFWLFSDPQVAKNLLEYRMSTLPAAKQRARELGHEQGALFAWRTIGGEECSSFFPAGTAQYHINADIAYASRSYVRITGDQAILREGLAELILETARIWIGLGTFSDEGRFKIFSVTGPDEYTAVVDNNYYTNKLAQMHLSWAVEVARLMQNEWPDDYRQLADAIELGEDELAVWQRAADHMHLPYDERLGIVAQDDNFLQKPKWDFANVPKDKYPLLLHFHPLVIYRHQVLKQPDALLALVLEGESEDVDLKRRCYDYYESICTHDSTLSTCMHGVLASEIGYHQQAYDYFKNTLRVDLDDDHKNTYYGVHTAAMGGIWMGAVQGFAGLRYGQGRLSFKPALPEQWRALTFKVRYQQRQLQVTLRADATHYKLLEGDTLTIEHHGQPLSLTRGEVVSKETAR
ncbi:glycoside hydrolase family 65 protein [Saccharospirillum salsuginis]|uniref:Glycosyl hydrolase n=1 Tax=Saccharospirillum salsuginis TaxID=418750 RepID=A0A918KJK7_9GAMM|nr:glycoside hydrolase family 65 protein [Saccharospirillum salsuginis]GGX64157.1 glycosyl hydrolase [Saccharospirillum salsuginis]